MFHIGKSFSFLLLLCPQLMIYNRCIHLTSHHWCIFQVSLDSQTLLPPEKNVNDECNVPEHMNKGEYCFKAGKSECVTIQCSFLIKSTILQITFHDVFDDFHPESITTRCTYLNEILYVCSHQYMAFTKIISKSIAFLS